MVRKKNETDHATKIAINKKLFQFGQQIRATRRQRKLTQQDLGEMIGLNVGGCGSICRLENGRMMLSFSKMVITARKMGLDLKISFSLLENEERPAIPEKKVEKLKEVAATKIEAKIHGPNISRLVVPTDDAPKIDAPKFEEMSSSAPRIDATNDAPKID